MQAGNPPTQPSFFLTQQQLQMLQYLQQKQTSLNSQEELLLQQLSNQYKLMEQYQQGVVQQNSNEKFGLSKNEEKPAAFENERVNPPPSYSDPSEDASFSKTNTKFEFVESGDLGTSNILSNRSFRV